MENDNFNMDMEDFKIKKNILESYIDKMINLKHEKEEAEVKYEQIKEDYKKLSEQEIPSILNELGLKEYTNVNNRKVKNTVKYRASIQKEPDEVIVDLLKRKGIIEAVNKVIVVDLETLDEDSKAYLLSILRSIKAFYRIEYTINHNTLSKIIKELIEKDQLTEEEKKLLHVYEQNVVTIKK